MEGSGGEGGRGGGGGEEEEEDEEEGGEREGGRDGEDEDGEVVSKLFLFYSNLRGRRRAERVNGVTCSMNVHKAKIVMERWNNVYTLYDKKWLPLN